MREDGHIQTKTGNVGTPKEKTKSANRMKQKQTNQYPVQVQRNHEPKYNSMHLVASVLNANLRATFRRGVLVLDRIQVITGTTRLSVRLYIQGELEIIKKNVKQKICKTDKATPGSRRHTPQALPTVRTWDASIPNNTFHGWAGNVFPL